MKLIDILVQELPKRGGWPNGALCSAQSVVDGEVYFYDHQYDMQACIQSMRGKILLPISDDACTGYNGLHPVITREQYESALAAKNYGWIEWPDNRIFAPVHSSTLVDVMYGDGEKAHGVSAGNVVWEGSKTPEEHQKVIAYRLHHPQEETQADNEADLNDCIGQDVASVWSGDGLPPVGCECELKYKCHDDDAYWEQVVILWQRGDDTLVEYIGDHFKNTVQLIHNTSKHADFRPIRSEADKKRDEAKHTIAELCRSAASNGHAADLIYDAIAAGKIPGVKLDN